MVQQYSIIPPKSCRIGQLFVTHGLRHLLYTLATSIRMREQQISFVKDPIVYPGKTGLYFYPSRFALQSLWQVWRISEPGA